MRVLLVYLRMYKLFNCVVIINEMLMLFMHGMLELKLEIEDA